MKPPSELGGEPVVAYAVLDNICATGATVHTTPTGVTPKPYGVAICKSPDSGGWFLFHCDGEWNVLADTWHASEAEAMEQAEFEFEGVTAVWQIA